MTERRVVVTGLGLITPLGIGVQETWQGLVEGKSGIHTITHFDPEGFPVQIAGEVKNFDVGEWMDARESRRFDRFIHLGLASAALAVTDARLEESSIPKERVGIVVGSGIGGLPWIEKNRDALRDKGPKRVSPFFIPGSIVNMTSGVISIHFGYKGPNSATCTACATSAHAIGDAYTLLKYGKADAMLAGGTEAVISPLAVAGFASMKALSRRNDDPEHASRPWDRDRDGFVIAEGSGVMVLETLESAQSRGVPIYAEVLGVGLSGDAYHMAAPDITGEGPARAMTQALEDADLKPEEVNYINAHGTSTPSGDIVEVKALKQVFGEHAYRLQVNSSKSMIGHTLGAAGAIESTITILTLKNGLAHATANLENPDEGCDLNLTQGKPQEGDFRIGLNNSFGFGGTNACILFKRWDA